MAIFMTMVLPAVRLLTTVVMNTSIVVLLKAVSLLMRVVTYLFRAVALNLVMSPVVRRLQVCLLLAVHTISAQVAR